MIELIAAIYARRSKRGDNLSTENQIERCLAYIPVVTEKLVSRYGDDVHVRVPDGFVFEDKGESGQSFDRAAYYRLRQVIANRGVHQLYIYAVDRLGRTEDVADMFLERKFCIDHGVQVWCESKDLEITATDEMALIQFFFESLWARRELEDIRRRTMQGRWTAHRVDRKHAAFGGRPVYGLAIDDDSKHFIVDEKEARVVRMMCNWVLKEYMTAIDIAKRLQRLGIPTPSGTGRWSANTVLRILRNSAIAGLGVQVRPRETDTGRRRSVLIPTPTVIAPDEFGHVQRVLEARRQVRSGRRYNYLLTGLLHCSRCGRAMIGSGNQFGAYYKCPARSKHKELDTDPCPMAIVPKAALEAQVLESAAYVAHHPAVLAEAARSDEPDERGQVDARVRAAERELEEAQRAQERLATEWAYRNIDQSTLVSALDGTRAQIEELEKELIELQWRQMVLGQRREGFDPLADIADMPLEELSDEAKRGIVRLLMHRIDLYEVGKKRARAEIEYYRLNAALHSLTEQNSEVLSNWTIKLSVAVDWR